MIIEFLQPVAHLPLPLTDTCQVLFALVQQLCKRMPKDEVELFISVAQYQNRRQARLSSVVDGHVDTITSCHLSIHHGTTSAAHG